MSDYIHSDSFISGIDIFSQPVGENTNMDLVSYIERTKSYIEEYKYNLSLATSKFKLNNAKENNISESFFFNVLIETGSICAFIPKLLNGNAPILKNVIFQPYNTLTWNYYVEPEKVNIIPYYANGVNFNELGFNRTLTKDDFEIIYLNNTRLGFSGSLAYEARMCSMLDICLYNNVLAKSIGLILEGKHNDLNDLQAFARKILNQNGIIAFETGSKPEVNELIKSVDINTEWLGDKIADAKKNLRTELHERLGITHAPYEKRERLTNVEIESQNEASDLLSQSTLDCINTCLDKVNDKFNLEYKLSVKFTDAGIDASDGEVNEEKEVTEIDEQYFQE